MVHHVSANLLVERAIAEFLDRQDPGEPVDQPR